MKSEFQGVCSKNVLWAFFYAFPWFILTAFATARIVIREDEVKFIDQFMLAGKEIGLKKSQINSVSRLWFGAIKIVHADKTTVNPLYFTELSVGGLSESDVIKLLQKYGYQVIINK